MWNVQLGVVVLDSQTFAFLHGEDSRCIAASSVFDHIELKRVRWRRCLYGFEKYDNVFEPAISVDQITFVWQRLAAVILILGDLNRRHFRRRIAKSYIA